MRTATVPDNFFVILADVFDSQGSVSLSVSEASSLKPVDLR